MSIRTHWVSCWRTIWLTHLCTLWLTPRSRTPSAREQMAARLIKTHKRRSIRIVNGGTLNVCAPSATTATVANTAAAAPTAISFGARYLWVRPIREQEDEQDGAKLSLFTSYTGDSREDEALSMPAMLLLWFMARQGSADKYRIARRSGINRRRIFLRASQLR